MRQFFGLARNSVAVTTRVSTMRFDHADLRTVATFPFTTSGAVPFKPTSPPSTPNKKCPVILADNRASCALFTLNSTSAQPPKANFGPQQLYIDPTHILVYILPNFNPS